MARNYSGVHQCAIIVCKIVFYVYCYINSYILYISCDSWTYIIHILFQVAKMHIEENKIKV